MALYTLFITEKDGAYQQAHAIDTSVCRIGSGDNCTVQLPGLAPCHLVLEPRAVGLAATLVGPCRVAIGHGVEVDTEAPLQAYGRIVCALGAGAEYRICYLPAGDFGRKYDKQLSLIGWSWKTAENEVRELEGAEPLPENATGLTLSDDAIAPEEQAARMDQPGLPDIADVTDDEVDAAAAEVRAKLGAMFGFDPAQPSDRDANVSQHVIETALAHYLDKAARGVFNNPIAIVVGPNGFGRIAQAVLGRGITTVMVGPECLERDDVLEDAALCDAAVIILRIATSQIAALSPEAQINLEAILDRSIDFTFGE